MIILDTNVVSEPLRTKPNAAVAAWLDQQASETLYLAATSLAELLTGVEIMPEGRRKNGLMTGLSALIASRFASRILPFDEPAAIAYGAMNARARSAGRVIPFGDGQIAAIAIVHGFQVATRDTAPFIAASVRVIDPWTRD